MAKYPSDFTPQNFALFGAGIWPVRSPKEEVCASADKLMKFPKLAPIPPKAK